MAGNIQRLDTDTNLIASQTGANTWRLALSPTALASVTAPAGKNGPPGKDGKSIVGPTGPIGPTGPAGKNLVGTGTFDVDDGDGLTPGTFILNDSP